MARRDLSGADVVRALASFGFEFVSQRGSHTKLRNAAGRTVIVPMHKELAFGTLRGVLRQAGVSFDDFIRVV